jgi:hypothetical protein
LVSAANAIPRRQELHLANFDSVLQTYFLICCAAADIPSTRFMSREPAGQNSTGESDLRNYYDRPSSDQKVRLSPALTRLDEGFKRSILGPTNEDDGISVTR